MTKGRTFYFKSDIANVLRSLFVNRFGPGVTRQTPLDETDEMYLRALVAVGIALGLQPEDWAPLKRE